MELQLNKKYRLITSTEISSVEKEFFIYRGRNKNIFEYHLTDGLILSAEYCDDFDGDLDLESIKKRIQLENE